jgi:aspartate 4-decarboxylase
MDRVMDAATLKARMTEYETMSPFEIKDKLISLAKSSAQKSAATLLNAGRGNPNWVATTPREGFFLLGQFSITESKRVMDLPNLGGMPAKPGIAARLTTFLDTHKDAPGSAFLREMVAFAIKRFGFTPDEFVHELVDSIVGDMYPVPDRMLVHNERIVHEYLMWAMCGGKPPAGKFDLYAVEGGTAAMCYVFKSLMANRILEKGDTIALGTPIFTPYLEMPHLEDYDLEIVNIESRREDRYQFSDAEIAKLENPRVKMFCLVNPGNPSSWAVSKEGIDKIVKLVKTKRPDLLVLTDDVYGTFVEGFRSIMADLPHNTIGVYSFSKYFGCTGWRLGAIAVHEKNAVDEMIAKLPKADHEAATKRYKPISLDPEHLKFIDRIVADSRDVALNHTAGLSLPQQVQMTMFSLFELMDKDKSYQKSTMQIVRRRLNAALEGLGIPMEPNPLYAAYYGIIDLEALLREYVGEEVVKFMKENYHPLDPVYRLAADHAIVLLNGSGFAAPDWSLRISLANLPDDAYDDIGRAVRAVGRAYAEAYQITTGKEVTVKGGARVTAERTKVQ